MTERRATQRDREAAIARLKPRLADGALSTDTFALRVERALTARTKAELRALLVDLPNLRDRLGAAARRTLRSTVGEAVEAPAELRLPRETRKRELVIGRADDCDLVLDDPTVSRHHAVLRRTSHGWELRDTGSKNGSWLNGWRVEGTQLEPGDELALGEARFVVRR